jgi:Predicted transcriptional regulator
MNDIDVRDLRKNLNVSQEKLAEMLGVHPRTIQNYEVGGVIPNAKRAILHSLYEKAITQKSTDNIPASEPEYTLLLPIAAIGGHLNDFTVGVKGSDCERIVSPIKGADFAITVTGDSMAPEYPSGSQVLIKKVNERAFLSWGNVFVLDTVNGTVIKKIFPGGNTMQIHQSRIPVLCYQQKRYYRVLSGAHANVDEITN